MARALVIEDYLGTAAKIALALGDAGFEADCLNTGRDGLLQAAAGKFDAIVLDRMLPGDLDGLAVLSTLRTIAIAVGSRLCPRSTPMKYVVHVPVACHRVSSKNPQLAIPRTS